MNLNFGMNILPSSCYTCDKFQAPPTSGLGGLVIMLENRCFMLHRSGQQACLQVSEVEGPNCLQTKWKAWGS